MTSVLQPIRPLPYASQSPPTGGGILLNPSPYSRTTSLPQSSSSSRSNHYISSSTSSSEDVNTPPSSFRATPPTLLSDTLSPPYTSNQDHLLRARGGSAPEYSASGSRRIRFAPLPDPRRAVLVTEQGEELPLPSVFDDDDSGDLRNFYASPSSSLLLGDNVVTPKEVPTITSGPPGPRPPNVRPSVSSPPSPINTRVNESSTSSTATITSNTLCSSASSTRFARRFLPSFRYKADDSRRSGSRDSSSSRDDAPPSWGIPLGHWASADESSRSASTNGEPLSRARSATSTTQSQPKRMLNGRVYGARKHQHHSNDYFKTIPDDEPEFVEWGYGGMGSVHAGGIWAKVQSDQKFAVGHSEERGRRGAPHPGADDDDDDGSGMGWVKKRREERERKKREEQAVQEAASKSTARSAPNPTSASGEAPATVHVAAHVPVVHDISTVKPPQPRPEDDDDSSDESDEEVEDEASSAEQDDDEGDQERYLHVLGAGVERVSRHHRD